MTEVRTQTVNPRAAIREARQQRLRVAHSGTPTVKVWPANEAVRQALRHGSGIRFRKSLNDSVEWPNDSFTKRRIAEGAVLTEGPGAGGEPPKVEETHNARQQAATRAKANKAQRSEAKPAEAKPVEAKPAATNGNGNRTPPEQAREEYPREEAETEQQQDQAEA